MSKSVMRDLLLQLISKTSLLVFLLSVPTSFAAAGSIAGTTTGAMSFVPAQLPNGGADYVNRIEFPNVDGDVSMVVRCYAHAHFDGFAGDAECFGSLADRSDTPYVRAVLRGTKNFRVIPARLNGKAVSVWMNFSFKFTQRDGQQEITVYPNHLRYGIFFGGNYSAPQRLEGHTAEHSVKTAVRVKTEFRDDSLADRSHSPRAIRQKCGIIRFLRTETRVSSSGQPLEAQISSKDEDGVCQELTPSAPLRGQYIPAIYEGKPFAAVFAENYGRSAYSGPLGKCHDHQLANGFRINQDSGGPCE